MSPIVYHLADAGEEVTVLGVLRFVSKLRKQRCRILRASSLLSWFTSSQLTINLFVFEEPNKQQSLGFVNVSCAAE